MQACCSSAGRRVVVHACRRVVGQHAGVLLVNMKCQHGVCIARKACVHTNFKTCSLNETVSCCFRLEERLLHPIYESAVALHEFLGGGGAGGGGSNYLQLVPRQRVVVLGKQGQDKGWWNGRSGLKVQKLFSLLLAKHLFIHSKFHL